MRMPIYIDPQTPGAADVEQNEPVRIRVADWPNVCRSKTAYVWVRHLPYRELSRWTHADRKRPFMVAITNPKRTGWSEISAHKTLAAAIKAAEAIAKEGE